MGNASTVLNGERAKLSKAGKKLLDEFVQSLPSSQSQDEKVAAVQEKLNTLLISHPLPAIRMIKFENMVKLKTFPRCPDNMDLTCELSKLDRNNSFLVFISHCWLRGYPGAEGWDGRPHPDNASDDKFKLCVSGIQKLKQSMAHRMKECYVWLDFGCINQDGNPAGELEQLDKIVQCCDCIFTPILDREHASWQLPANFKNWFVEYQAKLWNDGPHAYLNRGWCRVEMLYAANIPILENTHSKEKRHTMFEAGLAYHCGNNRRPHFLYGTKEHEGVNVIPYLLPPLQHSYFTDYHPLKGNLSVASDVEHIEQLIAELQPYIDATKIKVGYKGDLNKQGKRHGHGMLIMDNGDIYEGEWKNGKKCGLGTLRYAEGDVYEGHWKDGKKDGHGTHRYAEGDVYEGDWKAGNMNGHGVFRYASGAVYEGGWKDDKKHGKGKYRYDHGDEYEGDWKEDLKQGHGVYRYTSGAVYEGGWKDDKKHGKATYKYASGTVTDGEWRDGNMLE